MVVPAGLTIAELMAVAGADPVTLPHAHVWIRDASVSRPLWMHVKPKAGEVVTVRVVPAGGGGSGKNVLSTVLMIAVVAAAALASGGALAPLLGPSFAAGTTGAVIAGAVIAVGGSLLINALIPPPKPKLSQLSGGDATSPALSLTGTSNRAAPYNPVIRVYGRTRVFPPLAAQTFTEVAGDAQYLRALFDFGYGPLELSDLRIGAVPIEQYEDVEIETREGRPTDTPITLYSHSVDEDSYSLKVTAAGGPQIVESRDAADELVMDITFNGLVAFDANGNRGTWSVQLMLEYRLAGDPDWLPWDATRAWLAFTGASPSSATGVEAVVSATTPGGAPTQDVTLTAEYRKVGDPAWLPLGSETVTVNNTLIGVLDPIYEPTTVQRSFSVSGLPAASYEVRATAGTLVQSLGFSFVPETVSAASETAVRRGFRVVLPANGRYEVRVTRLTADTSNPKILDQAFITALRTVHYTPPVRAVGRCLVAMRIKATDQLNGILDQFSAIAQSLLPVWDGSEWVEQATRNQAWVYADILRGSANRRAVADDRLQLDDLKAWADANDVLGDDGEPLYAFDAVIDFSTTVFELLRDVAATARASFAMRDGKFSVVRDVPQSEPVQYFTPRNSWGFKGTKPFVVQPHALRVRYVEPDRDWSQQEIIAYADGFDATNATRFETLELLGCTNRNQAWREGRYHLAVAKLRPEVYEFNADIEHLVCTRGDLIRVAHDVPSWGGSWGRIKSVARDGGGNIAGLTLDETVTMAAGKLYAVRIRRATGDGIVVSINTAAGETTALDVTLPFLDDPPIAAGDLAMFGEAERESVELIVAKIIPGADLSARLLCVDAAPAVHDADTGPIPDFDAQISLPPVVDTRPAKPAVTNVRSDEAALLRLPGGRFQSRILIELAPRTGLPAADYIEVQYRRSGTNESYVRGIEPATSIIIAVAPVDDGQLYDVRLRAVTNTGKASDWVTISGHKVIGKTSSPPDVPAATVNGDQFNWIYPDPPLDLGGFLIRSNPGIDSRWSTAKPAHAEGSVVAAPPFSLAAIGPGLRTILIKAIDTSGNESLNAFALLRDPVAREAVNLLATEDLKAEGWHGELVNAVIAGGEVQATDDGVAFWPPDNTAFWAADTKTYWPPVNYLSMSYTTSIVAPAGTASLPRSRMWIETEIEGAAPIVEFRREGTAPFWPVDANHFWGDDAAAFWPAAEPFQPWPEVMLAVGREAIDFRISIDGGPVQGRITALTSFVDCDDVTEQLLDVAIDAGGTRLPLGKTYRTIKDVSFTLLADGGDAVGARLEDRDPELGPLVRTLDPTGAGTAGHINATIRGF